MMKVPYDSELAKEIASTIQAFCTKIAYFESINLAKEKGPFPNFDADKFVKSNFITEILPEDIRNDIRIYGIRNCALLTIPPVGTGSLIAGNISNGIEPIFSCEYNRNIRQMDNTIKTEAVEDYAWRKWKSFNMMDSEAALECRPDYFKTAMEIDPIDHIKMQAALQKYIDNSISKCIAKGTKIHTNKGIFNIEDLGYAKGNDIFANPIDNLKIRDINGEWKKITKHYSGGIKPTKIIKFDNGFSIECANTHKLYVNNNWVSASNLNIGDYVYCRNANYLEENSGKKNILFRSIDFRTNSNKICLPKKMSDDLALLLGMYAADGSSTESSGYFGITTANDDVENLFKELCYKVFNINNIKTAYDKRTKNTRSVFVTSRELVRYIQYLMGFGCVDKFIPDQIMNGSESEQINFINGISLDGYISSYLGKYYLYEGYSKRIVESLFYMCCNLGLKPKMSKKYVKNGRLSKYVYSVRVGNNPFDPIERHKRNNFTDCNLIPTPDFVKTLNYKDLDKKYYTSLKSCKISKNIRGDNKLLELGEYDKNLYLIKITSIEDSFNEVYDIEVEDTHSYLISNIISHNTVNLPSDYTLEDYKKTLMFAIDSGLKGYTSYRSGTRDAVLIEKKDIKQEIKEKTSIKLELQERPRELDGKTYKIKDQHGKVYVTVNHIDNNGTKKPWEIFMYSSNENQEMYAALGKTLSAIMRRNDDISFIIDDLKSIKSSTEDGGYFTQEYGFIRSKPQHIGLILEEYVNKVCDNQSSNKIEFSKCPECNELQLVREGGCEHCLACNYSKCG